MRNTNYAAHNTRFKVEYDLFSPLKAVLGRINIKVNISFIYPARLLMYGNRPQRAGKEPPRRE